MHFFKHFIASLGRDDGWMGKVTVGKFKEQHYPGIERFDKVFPKVTLPKDWKPKHKGKKKFC